MARSQETVGKKEREKKKAKQKQDKQERKEQRNANKKGKSLDEMMAYLDENGNLSSTPPDPSRKKVINLEDIQIGAASRTVESPGEKIRKGVVKFFNDSKGYGFIIDQATQESIFVHINQLSGPIKEKDKVTFEVEKGHKGPNAVNVKKEG